MSKWRETTLAEIALDGDAGFVDGPFGSNLPAKLYTESGIPVIRGSNLTLGPSRFDSSEFVYVAPETAKSLQRSLCVANDIVFTKKGTLGQTGLVPEDGENATYLLSSNQMRLRVDTEQADALFVYYYVSSPSSLAKINRDAEATGVPKTNLAYFRDFPITMPDLPEQKRIAHILGTLDDKIELNRRMNRTLEAIARAIFKSWFVDFDPVHAKVEGREPIRMDPETATLFSDSFQDSPLGKIPKGWEVGHLADHIQFALGGDWGREAPDTIHTEPTYCIRGTDLPAFQQGQLPELRLRYLKPASRDKRSLRPFDLVFEVSGGSPTQSTGRSFLVNEVLLDSYDHPLVCTNFCRLVRFSTDEAATFASFLLDHLYSSDALFAHETGTTTIKNFAFKRFVESFDMAISDGGVLSAFFQLLAPLSTRRTQNGKEMAVLSTQRNTLLPELLSGRLE